METSEHSITGSFNLHDHEFLKMTCTKTEGATVTFELRSTLGLATLFRQ